VNVYFRYMIMVRETLLEECVILCFVLPCEVIRCILLIYMLVPILVASDPECGQLFRAVDCIDACITVYGTC
jgi:hypothetical protein